MRVMYLIVIVLLWCVATSCASSTSAEKAPVGIRESAPEGISAPRVVHRVAAEYSADLRQQRVSGSVVIAGTVPKEGGVLRNPHVISSTDPRLNQSALDAVAQWTWTAGLQNGQAVDVEFQTTVTFSLK
jgi:TonB family protein